MDNADLGRTGIKVSPLCFGALTIGPLQADLSIEEGADVIAYALERGINFIDTAQLYGTYPHIRRASRLSSKEFVVSTKSYAYGRADAMASLEEARKELDRDVIDIFMLHEQESVHTLEGHREALEFYLEEKEKGRIRAVGVSTHRIGVVEAVSLMDEIDVIHPIVNIRGTGIGDGTVNGMLEAVEKAWTAGKGVFSMKPLGGGTLHREYLPAMGFVRSNRHIHSVAVGMRTREEVEMNVLFFEGTGVPDKLSEKISLQERKLHIEFWCSGCGRCIERCGQKALCISGGKASVHSSRCVLCGYCSTACPEFAIKIF